MVPSDSLEGVDSRVSSASSRVAAATAETGTASPSISAATAVITSAGSRPIVSINDVSTEAEASRRAGPIQDNAAAVARPERRAPQPQP